MLSGTFPKNVNNLKIKELVMTTNLNIIDRGEENRESLVIIDRGENNRQEGFIIDRGEEN